MEALLGGLEGPGDPRGEAVFVKYSPLRNGNTAHASSIEDQLSEKTGITAAEVLTCPVLDTFPLGF